MHDVDLPSDGVHAALPYVDPRRRRLALLVTLISGLCMLACEVLWSRVLTFVFGHDTYAFASLLAIVLLGLAIGGVVHRRVASRDPGLVSAALLGSFACLFAGFTLGGGVARDPQWDATSGSYRVPSGSRLLSGSSCIESCYTRRFSCSSHPCLAGALFASACQLHAGLLAARRTERGSGWAIQRHWVCAWGTDRRLWVGIADRAAGRIYGVVAAGRAGIVGGSVGQHAQWGARWLKAGRRRLGMPIARATGSSRRPSLPDLLLRIALVAWVMPLDLPREHASEGGGRASPNAEFTMRKRAPARVFCSCATRSTPRSRLLTSTPSTR